MKLNEIFKGFWLDPHSVRVAYVLPSSFGNWYEIWFGVAGNDKPIALNFTFVDRSEADKALASIMASVNEARA
jgi:hypothetical protein